MARRIRKAQGLDIADLCVTNARIVDVFSGEILENTDLLIGDGIFLAFVDKGTGRAAKTLDAQGRYLLPGLIDAHVHIESSHLCPEQFAAQALPHGVTTVVADPHEIANVLGMDGIRYMLDSSAHTPLDVRFMLPSCVPATPFEHAGAELPAGFLAEYMGNPRVLGLGEMMNTPGVCGADAQVLDKLLLTHAYGKVVDGHAPALQGAPLDAYCGCGIHTDHECSTPEEMRDRLRRGMYVLLRQGSAACNLAALLPAVTPENSRRCCFCTDDASPADILEHGYIERHVRMAVAAGIPPMTAIRMATLNTAECYNMTDKGAVAPGYAADFLLTDDLHTFAVRAVYAKGKAVAADGGMLLPSAPPLRPASVCNTMRTMPLQADSFAVPVPSGKAHVISVIPHEIITKNVVMNVRTHDGLFDPTDNAGLLKIAVVERHKGTGTVGTGILHGYCKEGVPMRGAIATTVSHDSHNIIVAGDNDADMRCAVATLSGTGGGICLIRDGRVLNMLPLPIAGLMSFQSAAEMAKSTQELRRTAMREFSLQEGVEPVMTLSFMALVVIPSLRITDQGLFDVDSFSFCAVDAGSESA